jgi:hypothetical protein
MVAAVTGEETGRASIPISFVRKDEQLNNAKML